MSTEQKVALVRGVEAEFGLRPALDVLSLSRSTWYYQSGRRSYADKYAHLRESLESIATAHPEYGYRRVTTELREVHDSVTNHKVVRRLHQLWELPLKRSTRPPRPSAIRRVLSKAGDRVNLVVALSEIGPLEVFYTDFTELVYATGKAYLAPILDHTSKVVLGYAVGERDDTAAALKAWRAAKARLRRFGRTPRGCIVHHDQDSVYTSHAWLGQLLLRDQVRVSYTLRGAKDNTEMEAFNSRFKNENRSLLIEAANLDALRRVVAERIRYYNGTRRHSALDNRAPLAYLRDVLTRTTNR
jgi:transposase InsO family protein